MADSEGSGPNRGVQWVFIGIPGAKRHVYAVRLAKLLEVPHISMASLVRQDLSPRSSLYKQVSDSLLSICVFRSCFLCFCFVVTGLVLLFCAEKCYWLILLMMSMFRVELVRF